MKSLLQEKNQYRVLSTKNTETVNSIIIYGRKVCIGGKGYAKKQRRNNWNYNGSLRKV